MWPTGWPPAEQITAELPVHRMTGDITAAGELLARAGIPIDHRQFFQLVQLSGDLAVLTAARLTIVVNAEDDEPVY